MHQAEVVGDYVAVIRDRKSIEVLHDAKSCWGQVKLGPRESNDDEIPNETETPVVRAGFYFCNCFLGGLSEEEEEGAGDRAAIDARRGILSGGEGSDIGGSNSSRGLRPDVPLARGREAVAVR